MWFRKASARRQAIREDAAEAESLVPSQQRLRGHVLLIAAVFFLVACAVQFWPAQYSPYREGERATTDIRSPVAFQIDDLKQAEQIREMARKTSPLVLVATPLGEDHILSQFISLKLDVQNARSINDVSPEIRQRFPGLTDGPLRQIQTLDAGDYARMMRSFVAGSLRTIPFISKKDHEAMIKQRDPHVPLQVALLPELKPIDDNLTYDFAPQIFVVGEITPAQRAAIAAKAASDMTQPMSEVIASYFAGGGTAESPGLTTPTYAFDPKFTAELADYKASHVTPDVKPIAENEIIVKAGEVITPELQRTLAVAQQKLEEHVEATHPWAGWLSRLGKILTVLMLTVAGVFYVVRMNTGGGAKTLRQGWAVCGLLLASLIVARALVGAWPESAYLSGIAPTLLAAIILVIAYNQRFGLAMAGLQALLVTVTLGLGLDFFLAMMTGAAVFCFGLHEIRTRGKLIEMGFFAGCAVFLAVWALGLMRILGSVWNPWIVSTDVKVLLMESLWGAMSGPVVSMVMSAILPPVERVFKITTAMTLLELCDANKPLLRRLQQEAPGTFNHSLTVGVMAEAAANAIGANGLLCRVGAYYHDVGKLSKPQYFIENNSGGARNRHEKLSPAMSLLIIVGHVKDGIELAREYKLPWIIHQFIGQHHGTTLVEYFFHAAKKRQQEGDYAPEVSETEFRYPGPKPQTREAAIVMICDGCESMVRSIDEPTHGRIEAAVHNMITKRLMDGQFGECDLTLRQLTTIEEKLIRTLAAIHHGRVAYPAGGATDRGDSPEPMSQPA